MAGFVVLTCPHKLKSNCYLIAIISLFYYKLTLILGARCIDCVVIVGDSKITDVMGTLLRYELKYAGNSDLHIVDSCGNIDQVSSWLAIGNGESIAKPIVQTRWKENMTMREFANISCR